MTDAQATQLVMQLMAIPGRSGEEAGVQRFIVERLQAAGVKPSAIQIDSAHKQSAFGGETGNLIVKLPARGKGMRGAPRVMLSAHADTVPICVGCEPVERNGKIAPKNPATGLGGDDRAGCAVVLATALDLLESDEPHSPLTLVWTVQEEVGLHGARHLAVGKLGDPSVVYNFDGGSPAKVIIGATGGYRMAITARGLASHAGNHPERGVSAIAIAALAVADLHENGWHGQIEKRGKQGTSNVGVIQGGEATNVVTDEVTLRAEARSHDAKFRERIVREIERAFTRAAKRVKSVRGKRGSVEFDGHLDYEAFRLAADDLRVIDVQNAIRDCDLKPELAITNGGLDANWLSERVAPTVTLGCGQRQIHTAGEWLDLVDFHAARRVAYRLVAGSHE